MNTIEELQQTFAYDPNTGIIKWNRKTTRKTKKGKIAGSRSNGYINIQFNKTCYYAHRLAFLLHTGQWPSKQIDHINGVKDDNRWMNLRLATMRENHMNIKKQSNNTSGHKNVHFCKTRNKWIAKVKISKTKHKQSCFESLEAAVQKAKELRTTYYKEFARHE